MAGSGARWAAVGAISTGMLIDRSRIVAAGERSETSANTQGTSRQRPCAARLATTVRSSPAPVVR